MTLPNPPPPPSWWQQQIASIEKRGLAHWTYILVFLVGFILGLIL